MALTFAKVLDASDYWGAQPVTVWDITFDNSYPSGGYTIAAGTVGLRVIMGVDLVGGNTAALGQEYYWNNVTGKLMVLMAAAATLANADLTNATNIATLVARFRFFGR
jgi:hypothetical protein